MDQQDESFKSEVAELKKVVQELAQQSEVIALKKEMVELIGELLLYKAVVQSRMVTSTPFRPKTDVSKPKEFNRRRSAQEVENFMWGLEKYFKGMGIEDDVEKVNTATEYLTNTALISWCRRCSDEKRGGTAVGTWSQFQTEFKRQFYPHNAKDEALSKLRALKSTWSEGCRRGDSHCRVPSRASVRQECQDKARWQWCEGRKERPSGEQGDGKKKPSSNTPNKFKRPWEKKERGPVKCFNCDGPHFIKDCPEKNRLNAIGNDGPEENNKVMKVGTIASVRAVKPKVDETQLNCFHCKGPHMWRDCSQRAKLSKEEDKPESSEASKLSSMLLSFAKAN
ncbi:hypothetical protein V6N13_082079 [Hibiscus sabdariffa]